MRRFRSLFLLGGLLLAASSLPAQPLSTSALRVLGQPNLRQNGLNSVDGSEFFNPSAMVTDERGGQVHLYVADTSNNRVLAWADIRTYQRGGRADIALGQRSFQHTVARGIIGVNSSGTNLSFGLNGPQSLAVDPLTGDLYVADTEDNRIVRFISPFDNPARVEAEAVFGQLDFGTFAANAGGLSARTVNSPVGIDFDSEGNLWICDQLNHRVLRYTRESLNAVIPEADLVLGQQDFSSNSANGESETVDEFGFNRPVDLAFHPNGSLYVDDLLNNRILVFAAPFVNGQAATRVIFQEDFNSRIVAARTSASSVRLPNSIDIAPNGDLYVVGQLENRVVVFPQIATPVEDLMGSAVFGQLTFELDLPNVNTIPRASAQGLLQPSDVFVSKSGDVFISDTLNHRILRFNPGQTVATEVYGQSDFSQNGPNRITESAVGSSWGIAVDYSTDGFPLYVADATNNRILGWASSLRFQNGANADLVIGQADLSTAVANSDTGRAQSPTATSLAAPRGLAITENGDLYVADAANNRVLRFPRPFEQSGRVTADLVLGQTGFTTSISAAVSATSLSQPSDVEIGPNGGIYVADSGNNRVLQYAPSSGNGAAATRVFGQLAFNEGVGPSTVNAQTLAAPQGVHIDDFGFLYIADTGANRVVVHPLSSETPVTGATATTVLGQPTFSSFSAGTASTRMNGPRLVETDSEGNIYVADTSNNRVLIFDPLLFQPLSNGAASSVLGQPGVNNASANYNSPDGLATAQGLFRPVGLFIDNAQTLYVGDTQNSRVVQFLRATATVSAATFTTGAGVSPGSLVSLFGSGLTADETFQAEAIPLPTVLGDRVIQINDQFTAPQLFISEGQANFQLPAATPTGVQSISVRNAETDELIAGGTLLVSTANPGLFTVNQSGQGQVLALNQDGAINGPDNPAARGSVIQLFGTGQGATSPVVADGEAAPSSPLALTVAQPVSSDQCATQSSAVCALFNNHLGEVLFSGLAPGFVGLWQINVRVPDIPDSVAGAEVFLRITVNRQPSNNVFIAIEDAPEPETE